MLVVLSLMKAGAHAATGEENFNNLCAACHTIGGGIRIGPDLKGVNDRRSEEWLLRFIKSSQAMVRSGDPIAIAKFAEFKNIPMPDIPYSVDEIREVLAYIKAGGSGTVAQAPTLRAATPEDIIKGQGLFQGTIRFAHAGPACNSCHHVRNDAVIGGGVLARDLTTVFSRLGAPGVQAILGGPPFPVMEQAFKDRPLTEEEVVALVGFLQEADRQQAFQQPRDYGFKLFYSGTAGFVGLMGLFALFGRGRKKRPVNQKIFERQLKSK